MNLLKYLSAAILSSFVFTSCLDNDEPERTVQYNLIYNYSYVTDMTKPDSDPLLLAGAKYNLEYNVMKQTVTITIQDLQLAAAGMRYTYELVNLPYTVGDDGWIDIKAPSVVAAGATTATFTDFRLRQIGSVVDNTKQTMYYDISYNIDNRYSVRAITSNNIFNTVTRVTDLKTGLVTTDLTPYIGYMIDLDKKTVDLGISGFKFGDKSYSEINFNGLSFTVNDTNGFTIVTDGSPKAVDFQGKQISDFTITDFTARGTYLPELYISFTVNNTFRVSFQGTVKMPDLDND